VNEETRSTSERSRIREATKRVAGLLSLEPGSIMFGSHVGSPVKGVKQSTSGGEMFCHSPESWKELWADQAFECDKVEVEALLKPIDHTDFAMLAKTANTCILVWSVTRL